MTCAQELVKAGREEGARRTEVRLIAHLPREGREWPAIERLTGVNEAQSQGLPQHVDAMQA